MRTWHFLRVRNLSERIIFIFVCFSLFAMHINFPSNSNRIFSLCCRRQWWLSESLKACARSLSWKWKSWSYFTFIVIVYQYFSLLLVLIQTECKIFEIFILTLSILLLSSTWGVWNLYAFRDYVIKYSQAVLENSFLLLVQTISDTTHQWNDMHIGVMVYAPHL